MINDLTKYTKMLKQNYSVMNSSKIETKKEESLAINDDYKLYSILTKLEAGGLLYKRVKFKTPEKLKILGEYIYLVNTDEEARIIIDTERIFACTYSQLKEITEDIYNGKTENIVKAMIINTFNGR